MKSEIDFSKDRAEKTTLKSSFHKELKKDMKTEKLNKKYATAELADSFVFRTKLTSKQKKEANNQLAKARKRTKELLTDEQVLYARIMQLRFQMEDYAKSDKYDQQLTFSYFLKHYIKLGYIINKKFAEDIELDETELSFILNKHRLPSEKVIVRLGLHSNNIIPALSWYKLLEKEREHLFSNNDKLREFEGKHVKNRLKINL
jgi:hypothetical protein